MLRRTVRFAIVLIVLGVALNILAGWVCALLISPDANNNGGDPMTLAARRREFFERAGPDPGGIDPGRWFVSVAHQRPGVEFLDVKVEDRDVPSDEFRGPLPYIGYTRAGCPLPFRFCCSALFAGCVAFAPGAAIRLVHQLSARSAAVKFGQPLN